MNETTKPAPTPAAPVTGSAHKTELIVVWIAFALGFVGAALQAGSAGAYDAASFLGLCASAGFLRSVSLCLTPNTKPSGMEERR